MRTRLRYVLPLAGLLFVAPVQAASPPSEGQPTLEKVKQADKELEDWKKTNPAEYKLFVAIMQMTLGSLGYGTGPFDGVLDVKTQDAIQRYQRARQLPVTGQFDFITFTALDEDNKLLASPTSLPPLSVFTKMWDQGFVMATGT
jgi:peptidoglycan hydrolase-like protein with peptidoglycan-binding domain